MAVEIPVYVDISGAFDRAVREIPQEMPKLEKVLSRHALNMKIDMGDFGLVTIRELLTNDYMVAEDLEDALKRVRKAYNDAVAKGANKTKTSATVDNLAKAYGLLEQRVKGFYNSNNVAAMRLEDTIAKVTFKINDLKSKLSSVEPVSEQYYKINYELQIQRKRLADLTLQQMQYKAGIDASTSAYHKQAGIVKQLTGYFSGLYAAHSLVRFVKQVRDVTGELEYQRVALGHLLQDADFGNELFAKTVEAAKESPFRIGQLVTYTKQLAAYRIEQENLFDTTQRLADISAGLGVDMNRLILAFGQVRAASVLRGQELRQFTEAGIPLVELLAEKFRELGREGTTTADVFQLISERAVPFEYIKEIFEDLTNAGGMFYKMQQEQAKTLKGRWEKLKDAYDQALMSLGDSSTFQSWNDTILNILNGLAKNLNGIVRVINAASMAWAAYWVTTKSGLSYGARLTGMFIKEYGAVTTLKFGVAGLTAAFRKLWLAMKANWVGVAISAITGLITLFTTFKNKTKEVTGELSNMEKAIEKMKFANKEFDFEIGVIKRYKELASTTERTAQQNTLLAGTMEELKRLFPDVADRIGAENVSLEDQNELLEKNARLRREEAVEEAKNQLKTQNEIIRGLKDEQKAAEAKRDAARRAEEQARLAESVGPLPTSYQYGPGTYANANDLKSATIEAAKAASVATAKYEEISNQLSEAVRKAKELEALIDPSKKINNWDEWQRQIQSVQKDMMKIGDSPVFTDDEISGMESVYDLFGKLKKRSKDLTESINGMKEALSKMKDGNDAYVKMASDIATAEKTKSMADAIQALFGFDFSTKKSGSDNRLSNLKKDIGEITNAYKKFIELRKYMSERSALNEIDTLFPQLKGFEPTLKNTIDRIQGLLKDYKGPKDKVYLDMQRAIDTEISNLNFDELKRTLTDELNRISDEIKRSEAARNLYNSLLDLTGDDDLSRSLTVSVYGDVGKEFKDRIQQQLDAALASLNSKEIPDDLFTAISTAVSNQDFNTILKNIDLFPEEWQRVLKQMASDSERFEAERTKELLKTLEKAKTYGESRVKLAKENAERIAKINAMDIPEEQKKDLRERSDNKDANDVAKLKYDVFKDSAMYIKLFDNLDTASEKMLTNMRNHLVKLKENFKDLDPTQLKEMQDRLNEIDSQLAKRSPFAAIADGFRKYVELGGIQGQKQAEETAVADNAKWVAEQDKLDVLLKEYEVMKNTDGISKEELSKKSQAVKVQQKLTDKAKEQADASQLAAEAYGDAQERINKGVQALGEYVDTWQALANSIRSVRDYIADALGVEDIPIVDEMLEGVASSLSLIASILPGIIALNTILNKVLMSNPFIAIAGAIVATLGVIVGLIKGIINVRVERLNQKIEEQQKLLDRLSYSYSRLEEAEKSAFGTDYIENYSSRLANLQAQLEAYRAQEEAERNKGKKSDKDKILDYQNAARDAMDKLNEMQTEVSEKFLGTDLASAARDFASAWIDAYKSFGSTTDALKEKFADMIQSMVTESLAARLVQQQLKPIFDMIDSQAKAGGFSVADAAAVAAKTKETVGTLNIGLNNLMNALSGAGLNVRTMGTGLTGIARDVQGASEESILGLAAGINTQNFYMAQINANVITIVQALTGATGAAGASGANPTAGPLNLDLAMQYWSCLPTLDANVAELLRKVNSVISPTGSKTNTNYVAVG